MDSNEYRQNVSDLEKGFNEDWNSNRRHNTFKINAFTNYSVDEIPIESGYINIDSYYQKAWDDASARIISGIPITDIVVLASVPSEPTYYATFNDETIGVNIVAQGAPVHYDEAGNVLYGTAASSGTIYMNLTPRRIFKDGLLQAEYHEIYRKIKQDDNTSWELVTDEAIMSISDTVTYDDLDVNKYYWSAKEQALYKFNRDKVLTLSPWRRYSYEFEGVAGNPTVLTYEFVRDSLDKYFYVTTATETQFYKFNVDFMSWETVDTLINYYNTEDKLPVEYAEGTNIVLPPGVTSLNKLYNEETGKYDIVEAGDITLEDAVKDKYYYFLKTNYESRKNTLTSSQRSICSSLMASYVTARSDINAIEINELNAKYLETDVDTSRKEELEQIMADSSAQLITANSNLENYEYDKTDELIGLYAEQTTWFDKYIEALRNGNIDTEENKIIIKNVYDLLSLDMETTSIADVTVALEKAYKSAIDASADAEYKYELADQEYSDFSNALADYEAKETAMNNLFTTLQTNLTAIAYNLESSTGRLADYQSELDDLTEHFDEQPDRIQAQRRIDELNELIPALEETISQQEEERDKCNQKVEELIAELTDFQTTYLHPLQDRELEENQAYADATTARTQAQVAVAPYRMARATLDEALRTLSEEIATAQTTYITIRDTENGTLYHYQYTVYFERVEDFDGELYESMFQFYRNLMHVYGDLNDKDRIDIRKYILTDGHPGKTYVIPDLTRVYLDTANMKVYKPLEDGFIPIDKPFEVETILEQGDMFGIELKANCYYYFPKINKCYYSADGESYDLTLLPALPVEVAEEDKGSIALTFNNVYKIGENYFRYNPYEEVVQDHYYFGCDVFD